MGCLMSKKSMEASSPAATAQPITGNQQQETNNFISANNNDNNKSYSWSNRDRSQRRRYIIENEMDTVQFRLPGDINGEQFIIQNCTGCRIVLMDHSNTVMVDDCHNCIMFVGPTAGSVVMRNCHECRIMSASQQFRCRDCHAMELFLFCASQPAIESCYELTFSCFAANYQGLQEQFERANLKIYNNKWFNVYDFSIDDRERHWSIIPLDTECFQSSITFDDLLLSFEPASSLVPRTEGIVSFNELKLNAAKVSMLLFYSHSSAAERIENRARRFIQELTLALKSLLLLVTKQVESEPAVTKVLNRAQIKDREIIPADKRSDPVPADRLIILIYRGNFQLKDIYDIFHPDRNTSTEIKLQIIDGQQNQRFLDDCLSMVLDNSF